MSTRYLLITTTTPLGPEVGLVALRVPADNRDAIGRVLSARSRQHAAMWPGAPLWPVALVQVVEQLGGPVLRSFEVEVPR